MNYKIGQKVKIIGNCNGSCNRVGDIGIITADTTQYFDNAYKNYDELFKRIRKTLPNLRKARDKQKELEADRKKYEVLKAKFNPY